MKQSQQTPVERWSGCALIAALLLFAAAAQAQNFPAKPIRIVLPFGPVGLPDVLAREVAAKMTQSMGQQVIVDNKPGAGGIIAAQLTAHAPADGYTMMLTGTDYAITPALHATLPYDPLKDFAPVTLAIRGSLFLVVNSALGVKSAKELIALAKARPGEINYGSPGNGSLHHLGMEQFKLAARVDLKHVPYKGVTQATPALMSGQISVMFTTLPSVLPAVQAGRLRVLAVLSPRRSPTLPDLPTIAELGFPEFSVESTMGFVVPAATPRQIIDRLNTEIVKALNTSDVKDKLSSLDVEVVGNSVEQFGEQIRNDQQRYARLVRDIKLKMD